MRHPNQAAEAQRGDHARELQARLYRDIGISAVAAALRFTALPEPAARPATNPAADAKKTLAA